MAKILSAPIGAPDDDERRTKGLLDVSFVTVSTVHFTHEMKLDTLT